LSPPETGAGCRSGRREPGAGVAIGQTGLVRWLGVRGCGSVAGEPRRGGGRVLPGDSESRARQRGRRRSRCRACACVWASVPHAALPRLVPERKLLTYALVPSGVTATAPGALPARTDPSDSAANAPAAAAQADTAPAPRSVTDTNGGDGAHPTHTWTGVTAPAGAAVQSEARQERDDKATQPALSRASRTRCTGRRCRTAARTHWQQRFDHPAQTVQLHDSAHRARDIPSPLACSAECSAHILASRPRTGPSPSAAPDATPRGQAARPRPTAHQARRVLRDALRERGKSSSGSIWAALSSGLTTKHPPARVALALRGEGAREHSEHQRQLPLACAV
jgi:hypothetical protein